MAMTEGAYSRAARWSFALNVIVVCVVGAALAVVLLALVHALSYRVDVRADLTRDGRYATLPAAAATLRALDADVEVVYCFGRDEDIIRRTVDLAGRPRDDVYFAHYQPLVAQIARRTQTALTEWAALSPRLKLTLVDADREPQRLNEIALARQKKPGEMVNRVWFRRGADERSVPTSKLVGTDWGYYPPDPRGAPTPPSLDGKWRVQAELAEALRGVAAGERVKVYLPRGKRARVEAEDPASQSIRATLQSQGFETVAWTAASGPPQDGIVLLAALAAKLDPEEIAALRAFEAAGGRMLLCGDPRQQEDFAGLLEPWGLRLDASWLEDPVHGIPADPSLLRSPALFYGAHPTVVGLAQRAVLALEHSRPIVDEKAHAPGAVREPILRASSEALAVPVDYDRATGVASKVVGAKRAAPHAFLGLACERPVDGGKRSRLVVFGGAGVVDRDAVALGVSAANRDLLLNSLNWLAERASAVGALEADSPGARVPYTAELRRFVDTTALGFLPAGLLLVAAIVHFRRRN